MQGKVHETDVSDCVKIHLPLLSHVNFSLARKHASLTHKKSFFILLDWLIKDTGDIMLTIKVFFSVFVESFVKVMLHFENSTC